MLSIFSRDQPETVRTSNSDFWPAIGYTLLGLPPLGVALFMPGGLIKLIPGGIGAWMGWKAYKRFRRWRAYGSSHLRLETVPVPLGESLRARLQVPLSHDEQPPNGFQVRVAAIERSGGDKHTKHTVWEDWTSVSGQPGPGETEVPLSLDLPAQPLPDHLRQMAEDKPWGSLQDTLDDLNWAMEVTASFEDTNSRIGKPDYEASFDLPVSVPDNFNERAADDASTNGSISSPTSDGAETVPSDAADEDEVYWGVGDDDKEADLRHADSESDASDDADEAFSEPVSAGIRMDGHPGEGLTFSFDHARPSIRSFGYKLAVPGVVFTVIGVPTFFMALSDGQTGLLLFAVLSVLGGGLALRKAWTILTHASSIRISDGQIVVKKGPHFLYSWPTRVSPTNLDEVKVRASAGSGSQSFYMLVLREKGAYTPTPVAGGLTNRDEAKWIADQIRRAVEQQPPSA